MSSMPTNPNVLHRPGKSVVLTVLLSALCGSGPALLGHASAQPKAAVPPTVTTGLPNTFGLEGMMLNGSIHPHGLYTTYYFEYGPTKAYGSKTPEQPLPPRLAAFYHESWDDGPAGWFGAGAKGLEHINAGGASGGFVRFSEPSRDDPNHDDGVGTVHLSQYLYTGAWGKLVGKTSPFLGGGDPDLRDARVSIHVRGKGWTPNGSELIWWSQSQSNIERLNKPGWQHANWAYTGFFLTDLLQSGKWEKATYRLRTDAAAWSYAGSNPTTRARYTYWPINETQAHLNLDFFHMVAFVDPKNPPKGAIDFDEFELAYRNHSLLLPSNGGKLLRFPKSVDEPATLTDGWRHGKGKTWRGPANPASPIELVWVFPEPLTIRTVQIHQNPEWPAKEVEVMAGFNETDFVPLFRKTMPEKSKLGPNFCFTIDTDLNAKARYFKVRINSGYRKQHWGLGEVEVFGSGAKMLPDDDLYYVTTDVHKLKPGARYHARLVARNAAGTRQGEDMTFTVPAEARPRLATGAASRIAKTTAKVQGRLNPLGFKTNYFFEYGPDQRYGTKTPLRYAGLEITARTVFAQLTGLQPDTTYHYRLTAVNEKGTTVGADAVFRTAGK
jgi:hypothetical protein